MKVGIALPARNVEKYIETCLDTLNAQFYDVSIYVVEDHSDDSTYQFLVDRPSQYTRLMRNDHRIGWPRSLNRAASMAIDDECDAVFLMNADDFLRLDAITKLVAALKDNNWAVGYGQQIGAENVVQTPLFDTLNHESFIGEHCPIGASGLIRKDVWLKVNGFSTDISLPNSFGYNEDWDFWLKVWEAGYFKYNIVREPIYYYRMHENQLHKDGLARHQEARKLIMTKHGLL